MSTFLPLNIAVLTVSDSRTSADDTSGDYLQSALESAGHHCLARAIVGNDLYQIRAQVSAWIADATLQVVLINGGTGFYAKNVTPEAVSVLFDRSMDGFGELFRACSYADIGAAALQSRALAGVANHTAIFAMPGSLGACQLAWEKLLLTQLDKRSKPCNFYTHLQRIHA